MYAPALLLALLIASARGVEEWRPMGQGDPLRDPTHVYSPPQVQHVHYWLKSPSIALEPPPSRAVGVGQVAGWPQVSSHYLTYTSSVAPTSTPVSITTSYPTIPYRLVKSPHSSPFVEKNSIHGGPGGSEGRPIFAKPLVADPPPPFTTSSSRPLNFFGSATSKKPIGLTFHGSTQPVHFTPTAPPVHFTPTAPPALPETTLKVPLPPTDNFASPSFVRWPNSDYNPQVAKYISTTVVYDKTTAAPTTGPTTMPPPPISFVIEGHSKVKKYGPLPETSTSIHRVNHIHLSTNVIDKSHLDDKYNPFRL